MSVSSFPSNETDSVSRYIVYAGIFIVRGRIFESYIVPLGLSSPFNEDIDFIFFIVKLNNCMSIAIVPMTKQIRNKYNLLTRLSFIVRK